MRSVIIACLAALLLSACSGVQLAYKQLDWLVPRYVGDYVALDDAQAAMLDRHMRELLKWHCGTQLSDYAGWLREANAELQSDMQPVSFERVAAHQERLSGYWRALMERTSHPLAELLSTASPRQIEDLFANLEKDNREFKAENVDRPDPALRRDLARKMEDQLDRWIGRLSSAQRQGVKRWSEEIALTGADRMEARRRWQVELGRLLAQRGSDEDFARGVRTLLMEPQRLWPESYLRKHAANRERTLNLLVEISNTLSGSQRGHLAKSAGEWAEDFDRLACTPPEPLASRHVSSPVTG